ncbi:MAG: pyruvate:ferredoxin (flavodoxin) oxidoreductase [Elusimicrobia bacterium]|nr:pyruvate:ferredoxin (flavodoxin) oxidoreductase [Elusimicrobiota bacterium]MBK7207769.1 pyruvate:ferredoxin (flavodoxin) oxidoreductase [Elusimicrobiota bacterium]MBK7544530.1 pyruvate:ferredoxin (flavodoxin) oxidoreductase [Elusimicrobiota bacterium]MBK7574054.1 pyruvate:ferredoxin (flavodoxin) oxidoreductase [Elusimicrobiota bacterium]MBK7688998.1 pyruvate:ferredoxin (flavodoxin) oxidoreductase [Elusimicrobiota bacterium]
MSKKMVTIDGNEAVCHVAYKLNEVIAIYPITPSSSLSERADLLASMKQPNLWGEVPSVVEMQSEGGAAGAVHGALQTGSLSTTFTSSQGLLLMIPNMYKIAGELTSTVFHIAARSIAAQGLSIFNDHQDVMAVRQTGWAILSSNGVQEAMDLSAIAQASTLRSRVPFVHFFDGFRTSHEIQKVELVSDEVLNGMIDMDLVNAHRQRGLSPEHPFIRGTAQNPDVYFQARETVNPYYAAVPGIVQGEMDRYARLTGRPYKVYDYYGHPEADRVVVMMGSGCESVSEVVDYLNARGEKVGVLKVRLFRPFAADLFLNAFPKTVKQIAVLDKTKEPGAQGEPLYLDVSTAVMESLINNQLPFALPRIYGGRYGLSSKEFNAGMIKGLYDHMKAGTMKNHFTLGINDDVSHTSLTYDPNFIVEDKDTVRAVFWGLGGDGTVSANKNSIKIIGEDTPNFAQGFFFYDSKKAGAITISHLRFGKKPIRSSYLIQKANFVACHDYNFMGKYDVLKYAEEGATFLLNSPFSADKVWEDLPATAQHRIIEKKVKFYVLDGYGVAKKVGLGRRFNIPLQTAFFALANILPKDEAVKHIKEYIEKTWSKKGEEIVRMNKAAVDQALETLAEVKYPQTVSSAKAMQPPVTADAPDFVQNVTAMMIKGEGDLLPVSALPADGTYPSGTTQYEKRNLALEMPVWDEKLCIQCGKCVIICPHACIRGKLYDQAAADAAPAEFLKAKAMFGPSFKDKFYTIQVAPEDCTGCTLCVQVCPAKSKTDPSYRAINMVEQPPIREREKVKWAYFDALPDINSYSMDMKAVKNVQLRDPLFEFSGACAGCGETPYLKLVTQLYGERAIVANATGCSSIYGGNLPTTPWSKSQRGFGPAWSNSLFEDAAEFGFGMTLSYVKKVGYARNLVSGLRDQIGAELADSVLNAQQITDTQIEEQRDRVAKIQEKLKTLSGPKVKDLQNLAENLVRKSLWIVGGDGWAYDIGYGGLDHVLASGENVNVLILDTEVYSNTGGQSSKSTPFGAIAKFASGGKGKPKKDLGLIAMTYQNIYVAQVAMAANDNQALKAFIEAEQYDGPSLIIAYSPCIEHGYDLSGSIKQTKSAVDSGYWPLFRYDPRLAKQGKNPFQLDSKKTLPLRDHLLGENRFVPLTKGKDDQTLQSMDLAQKAIDARWAFYERLANQAAPSVSTVNSAESLPPMAAAVVTK